MLIAAIRAAIARGGTRGVAREVPGANGAHDPADVQPLRTGAALRFFGAGGPKMAAAGVEQVFDLTQHSVIGFAEVLKIWASSSDCSNSCCKSPSTGNRT